VDKVGARQAMRCQRLVLTSFHLSQSGWIAFQPAFHNPRQLGTDAPSHGATSLIVRRRWSCRCPDQVRPWLTFLNSGGLRWGEYGRFSVEAHTGLELEGAANKARVGFYDVYGLESDLTVAERQTYNIMIGAALR
jgi:hypothetical protein